MDARPPRFFFIHVMKTGGTSLVQHAVDNFGDAVHPAVGQDPRDNPNAGVPPYISIEHLRAVPAEHLQAVRFVAGHFPYAAVELIRPDVTITVLRDPVERTISLLRHVKRYEPDKRHLDLEAIYDDPMLFPLMIRNYQSKLFAMTLAEAAPEAAHLAVVEVDDARLEEAKANLARVDVLGLHHRYGELLEELAAGFGWRRRHNHRRRAATEDWQPSPSLCERIAADNAADMAFYRYAEELHARQRGAA